MTEQPAPTNDPRIIPAMAAVAGRLRENDTKGPVTPDEFVRIILAAADRVEAQHGHRVTMADLEDATFVVVHRRDVIGNGNGDGINVFSSTDGDLHHAAHVLFDLAEKLHNGSPGDGGLVVPAGIHPAELFDLVARDDSGTADEAAAWLAQQDEGRAAE